MSSDRIFPREKRVVEVILILMILALGCFLSYYHHLSYEFPLHVDEWFHIAMAKQIAKLDFRDPYYGKPLRRCLEIGWHSLLALFVLLTDDVRHFTYLPSFFHALDILATFFFVDRFLGRKEAFFAALLAAIIPSHLAFGGPIFLVPINLSLIFLPISLMLAFDLVKLERNQNLFLQFLILTFLLYAHPPSAVALLAILGIYVLLLLFDRKMKKAISLILVISLSIFCSLPNYADLIASRGIAAIKFTFFYILEPLPFLYGLVQSIFFVIGFLSLVIKLRKKRNLEILTILIAVILFIFNILCFENLRVNILLMYQRTFLPLFFLMNVISAYGFKSVLDLKFGKALALVSCLIMLYLSISHHLALTKTHLYHLITEKDYENFLWIKHNTPHDIIAILNPWKAKAFPAIAERRVYSVMPFGPNEEGLRKVKLTEEFFNMGCKNTKFLKENNISLVYTLGKCHNEDLIEVKRGIYILKGSKLWQLL